MRKVKVGVIGCGMISAAYLKNCTQKYDILDVVACADLMPELARKRAEEFNIPKVYTVEELLADPEIEIVINLTVPKAHAEINVLALEAGKHVYVEKPFAVQREDAQRVLQLAESKGLLVGGAPDTFLGGGLQTCRKIIDDGWIGTPYAASGQYIMGNSADGVHPNPAFFFQEGGGPLFDMGPYYITALVTLLGPVRRVTGSAQQLTKEKTINNPKSPRYGEKIQVEVPTNVSAVLDLECGVVATLTTAKESFGYTPRFEIYGTEGILYANDPNMFGGAIYVHRRDGEKKEVPYTHGFAEEGRGLGVADMAHAILSGRKHRANGELTYHVLDVMHGIHEASRDEKHVHLSSTCNRPSALPLGLRFNSLDL
jgi:predicted dehydrogenase